MKKPLSPATESIIAAVRFGKSSTASSLPHIAPA